MEIYVYIDDVLVSGDDADIDFILPLNEHGYIQDSDDALASKKRLSVYIPFKIDKCRFPDIIQEDMQIIYNCYSSGDNIYVVENGGFKNITDLFHK